MRRELRNPDIQDFRIIKEDISVELLFSNRNLDGSEKKGFG